MQNKIGYYFITDKGLSRKGNLSDVKNALRAKVKIIQYRNKSISTKEMYLEALRLRKICKNALFLINDRVDIALGVEADGVHLGEGDLPYSIARKLLGKKKIIGLTVRNLKEVKQAKRLGADYLSLGPIFKTTTKLNIDAPKGVSLIKTIKKNVSLPIIAIGGINLKNAPEVIRAGADGLCAISAVLPHPDVKVEIEKFQRLFRSKTLKK